jgi:hypothetical protein
MTVVIFDWLLILAQIGLIGVLVWLVIAALKIKTSVMKDAKRLYERPTRSVKNLITTGKGIAQQESVRVTHIVGSAKVAAEAVGETAGEIKTISETIHLSELKTAYANVQSVLKMLRLVAKVTQSSAAKQRPKV